mgnify:CR=1 FL=1
MPNSTTYRKSGATANYPLVGGISLKSTTDIDDGWYHIAVTLKRNGNAVMYINGEPEATVYMYNYNYEQTGFTYFGSNYEGEYVITPKCYIDDFCSWKLELTRDDIALIYNDGSPTDLRLVGSYDTDGAIKIDNLINYWEMRQSAPAPIIGDSTYSLGGDYEQSFVLLFLHPLVLGAPTTQDEVPGDSSFSEYSIEFSGTTQDEELADRQFLHTDYQKSIYGMNTIGSLGVNKDFSFSVWFKWDEGHPDTFPTVDGETTQNYIMASGDPSNTNYDNMVLKFNSSDKKIEFIFNEYQS